jgi:hypothetical protein
VRRYRLLDEPMDAAADTLPGLSVAWKTSLVALPLLAAFIASTRYTADP